jgi:beta-lactamase regulating signal transducer with metallopeptidase domain
MHAAFYAGMASLAVRAAWESLLLAAFLTIVVRCIPGLSPKAAFRLWSIGFLLSVLLPLCPGSVHGAALSLVHRVSGDAVLGGGAAPMQAVGQGVSRHAVFLHLAPAWGIAICGLWVATAAFALFRLSYGAWSLGRLVRNASAAPEFIQRMYDQWVAVDAATAGDRAARARLLVTDGLAAPSACGLFGPSILLPRGLAEDLSEEELESVLRHEAAHLRRWDDWSTVAVRLVRALLPCAVALPYIERRMGRAREMACDDAALRRCSAEPGHAVRYAACLARLAEKNMHQPWRGLAPGLGGEGSQLAARVGHILRSGEVFVRPGRFRVAAAVCAALGVATALLSAPAFCSFSAETPAPEVAALAQQPIALPQLTAPTVSATLPVAHVHSARWRVPAMGGSSAGSAAVHAEAAEQEAALRSNPSGTPVPAQAKFASDSAPGKRAIIAGTSAGKSAVTNAMNVSPQAVFVFWTSSQDALGNWSQNSLVLWIANPAGASAHSRSPIVLFNI